MPIPGFSLYDTTLDPAGRLSRMPINMGESILPHAITFQGTVSSIARVYRPSDEALKQSFENARIMRNDTAIMECVEMRQRACCLFEWHVEPENKKDQGQVGVAAELTRMLEDIPRFLQYRENLLHATWYGKYGIQHKWRWKRVGPKMRIVMDQWLPVNGDKIVFRYDDGLGTYRPDQVGIRIGMAYPGWQNSARRWERQREDEEDATFKNGDGLPIIRGQMKGKIQPTDYGLAYFLDTWERPLLAIHKNQIEDGEYEEPTNAGRIHGKGLRSVLYWTWIQKQEALSLLMEYLERSAFGFNVWYYPMHNPTAKEEIEKAALRQSESGGSRNIVFFPMVQDEQSALYRVEHIEPGMGGAESLKAVINEYFGHQIKRYILGQTLTSEASATGLGSNLAEVQLGTFMQIVRYDAQLLEETITTDLLLPMIQFNYPQYANTRFRFRIDTETPDAETRLNAIKMAYDMGLKIDAQNVRDLLGTPVPESGAEVLDMAALQKSIQPPPGTMGGGFGGGDSGGPEKNAMVHGLEAQPENAEYDADGPPSERSERSVVLGSDAPRAMENGIAKRLRDAFAGKRYAAFNEDEHPRSDIKAKKVLEAAARDTA
jgi:hypothetical protein